MDIYSLPADFSSNNQEHVQQLLTALGYNTGNTFTGGVYASTIDSIQSFQTSNVLPPSGGMSAETTQMLNARLNEFYRVYGELKNDYGMPVEGVATCRGTTRTLLGSGESALGNTAEVAQIRDVLLNNTNRNLLADKIADF